MQSGDSRSTPERVAAASGNRGRRILVGLLRLLLPLVVLSAGALVAMHFLETAPVAKQRPPERRATLVEVAPVRLTSERVTVAAMGTVTPARRVTVHPRVSGEVVAMGAELIPGGVVGAGDTLFQLDSADYELAIRELESDVARAEGDLRVELGYQSIAKKEVELLGDVLREGDGDLVLRKPQLESAQAALERARAALAKARLALERTTVRAPFNAVVESRSVDVGARVTETTALATLVGTDAYWVEVAVPVDDLQWLRIPRGGAERGSAVRVYDPSARRNGEHRNGRVLRLAAALEEQGRMAQVIVEVEDPLSLQPGNGGRPALMLGAYVRVEIEGSQVRSVAAVDRQLLRDGDTVWVMDDDGKLDIRPVEMAFRGRDRVLVSKGVAAGERLVTTDLPAPVQGMPLRTRDESDAPAQELAGDPDPARRAADAGRNP